MTVKENNAIVSDFEHKLARFSSDYVEGTFDGRKWGASVRRSTDGRRLSLFAEELGATDIVSFNLYRGPRGPFLNRAKCRQRRLSDLFWSFSQILETKQNGRP